MFFGSFRKQVKNKQNRTKSATHICTHCKKEIREGGVFCAGTNLYCRSCSFLVSGCYKLSDNALEKINICNNTDELHIFWNTNCKTLMSRQQYQEILKSFYRVYNEKYLIKGKSPIWTETEDTLSLSDSWSYYAYHDGTLSECFKISIQRENAIEPIWDSKKDWPCEKQQLLFHNTYGDDVREGWVSYSMHTALLLLNPFKLSGVWRLDIELSRNRY